VTIADAPRGEREPLERVLEESFTGVYLRHARRTLDEVDAVRVARRGSGEPVGLTMLKFLRDGVGYVYYIAVVPAFRRRGMGRRLLQDSLDRLARAGAREVYATVGEHNVESTALFLGRGFRRTDLGQVSKKYGPLGALSMYRGMWVVPGEVVMVKDTQTLGDAAATPD